MTIKQAIKYLAFSILMFLSGIYILYKSAWWYDVVKYFGVIGALLAGISSFFIALSLTRILIPVNTDFGYQILSDKESYKAFKKSVGVVTATVVSVTCYFILLVLWSFSLYTYFSSRKKSDTHQLQTYGQTQTVIITDLRYGRKSSKRDAYFNYHVNNKTLNGHLYFNGLNIGDTAVIIFSKQNPEVIQWKEKQQKPKTKKVGEMDIQRLSKLPPEQLSAKFGKPLKNDEFNLSQPLSEFRIEIYNDIPEKDRHSAEIKIKEYTWSYNKTDNLTVWYQLKQNKLISLHYSIWPKGATF